MLTPKQLIDRAAWGQVVSIELASEELFPESSPVLFFRIPLFREWQKIFSQHDTLFHAFSHIAEQEEHTSATFDFSLSNLGLMTAFGSDMLQYVTDWTWAEEPFDSAILTQVMNAEPNLLMGFAGGVLTAFTQAFTAQQVIKKNSETSSAGNVAEGEMSVINA